MAAVTAESKFILDARLAAYEKEILTLKTENKNGKTDLAEAKTSLTKITKELSLSQDNLTAIQTENKTLKLSLQELTMKYETSNKELCMYKNKTEQLSIRSEENDKTIDALRLKEKRNGLQHQKYIEEYEANIKQLNMENAKEIGQIQIKKQNELSDRINTFAKMENNLKVEISTLQKQMELMDREYKDTIAGQAQRLCAYEQQINIMEKQMNRLSIQNEFKSMPKLTNSDRLVNRLETENMTLSKDNKSKDNEIKQLMNRLAMTRLNNHYDFRNKGQY